MEREIISSTKDSESFRNEGIVTPDAGLGKCEISVSSERHPLAMTEAHFKSAGSYTDGHGMLLTSQAETSSDGNAAAKGESVNSDEPDLHGTSTATLDVDDNIFSGDTSAFKTGELSMVAVLEIEAAEHLNMTDNETNHVNIGNNDNNNNDNGNTHGDEKNIDSKGPAEVSDRISPEKLSVEITPGGISDHSVMSPSGISGASGTPPSSPKLPINVENAITRTPTERDRKVKSKRRGSAWNDDETDFLMEIWARHVDNSKGDDFTHNAPVYRLIAAAMSENGLDKSWEQCKTRIHTLKRAYKLTRDELNSGSPSITYCRHFDNLKIIMGEHPTTTPKMLADALAAKRQQREASRATIRQEIPKRKLPSLNKSAKKATIAPDETKTMPAIAPQPLNSAVPCIMPSNVNQTPTPVPQTSLPTQTTQQQTQQPQQRLQTFQPPSTNFQPMPQYPLFNQPNPSTPPYHVTSSPNSMPKTLSATQITPEINNNNVVIKQEKPDSSSQLQIQLQAPPTYPAWNTYTTILNSQQQHLQQQPPSTDAIERLRLDLEIKKIEVERNKIEMEERQRREERDHQYRMMQLLLFGLGQQSSTHACSGQSSDEVAHAPTGTTLTRALENGLVPGGSYTANEKGLSFSEI